MCLLCLLQSDLCKGRRQPAHGGQVCELYGVDGRQAAKLGTAVHGVLTAEECQDAAVQHRSCPFHGAGLAAKVAVDAQECVMVVVCHSVVGDPDYFSSRLGDDLFVSSRQAHLLVDEGHNLEVCAMDAGSMEVGDGCRPWLPGTCPESFLSAVKPACVGDAAGCSDVQWRCSWLASRGLLLCLLLLACFAGFTTCTCVRAVIVNASCLWLLCKPLMTST